MKLLIITNNPDRPSFRQRIGIYIDRLRESGIEPEAAKLPDGAIARWKLFRRASGFDAVFLHKKRLSFIDAFRLRKYARKIIYDFDDAVMYHDKQPENVSGKRLRDFKRTVRIADVVIAGNKYLAAHAKKFNQNIEVLPTGLDIGEYRISATKPRDTKVRLVWIGSKSTIGYLAGIKDALEEIGMKYPNMVLRIICDDFFDLENMEVEKIPWSLDTQARHLAESDIGLSPLPDNAFTRGKCGFKILQYMAATLPVVASPVGVNAEIVKDNITGLHATGKEQWVEKISLLTGDSELRNRLAENAAPEAEKFDLKIIGERLLQIISKI